MVFETIFSYIILNIMIWKIDDILATYFNISFFALD